MVHLYGHLQWHLAADSYEYEPILLYDIDGSVQDRRNFIPNALELHPFALTHRYNLIAFKVSSQAVADGSNRHSSVQNVDGLVPDCSNSSALAMELLQYCTRPSIYPVPYIQSQATLYGKHNLWYSFWWQE